MSKGTLGQVVKRAISDAAFRRQLQADPDGALKGFDLTSDERAALRSGDAAKLSGFGVDQRMSKAFALGEGASAVTVGANSSELSDAGGARAAFIDQDAPGGSGAQSALIDQDSIDGSGTLSSLIDGAGSGARAAVTDGSRLGQVNAAFEGGDRAAGGRALGDQHDGGRAAMGDSPASAGGRALGDQHDVVRNVVSGDAAGGREGTAYITADEAGRDSAPSAALASDSSASTAFMTADEMGNDVSARTGGDVANDAFDGGDTTTNTWAGDNAEPQA